MRSSARRTGREFWSASEYAMTVLTPISRQARITRNAISPRLAISTFLNMYVSCLNSHIVHLLDSPRRTERPHARAYDQGIWPQCTIQCITRPTRGVRIYRWPARTGSQKARISGGKRSLVEAALIGSALLLGVEICPHPGEALVAAIMGAVAVRRLPRPAANPLATDLALESIEAQLLLAAGVKAVHRAGIGEQRHAMRCHRAGDANQRLLPLEHEAASIILGIHIVIITVIVAVLAIVGIRVALLTISVGLAIVGVALIVIPLLIPLTATPHRVCSS